jgi:hypothetical protein
MSLIAATQFTAVATGILALFAMIAAGLAFLAFRKQSKEVGLLLRQAAREAEDRRRAQAAKVFVWAVRDLASGSGMAVHVRNTSEQPVYDLEASWAGAAEPMRHVIPGGGPCMPGEKYPPFFTSALGDDAAAAPLVRLDFRDAAGLRWRTTSQGQLTGPL